MLERWTLFHKMFVSYIVIVGCTIAIISGLLFHFFRLSSTAELELISTQALRQVAASSEYLNGQVESLSRQLQSEPSILRFLHLTAGDKAAEYAAYLQLQRYQALFSYINHIGLYNASLERYLTTQGISDDNSVADKYLNGPRNPTRLLFAPNYVVNPYGRGYPEGVLTTVDYLPRPDARQPFGAVVIHVNERYIHDMIAVFEPGRVTRDGIFVVNRDGEVLSHINSGEFMKNYSDSGYLREILRREEGEGSFRENVNGVESLVSFAKINSPDWIYVSVRDYQAATGGITSLLRLVVAAAVIILAAGVATGFLFAKRIYNPIQRLLRKLQGGPSAPRDEIAYLDRVLDETMDHNRQLEKTARLGTRAIREQRLRGALTGREPLTTGEDFFGGEEHSHFWAAALRIDDYASLSRSMSPRDLTLAKFAIRNVADELLGAYGHCETVEMRENLIAAVASGAEPEPRELYGKLELISRVIADAFAVSLSAGLGDIQTNPGMLGHSWLSASGAVEYKVFYGNRSILTSKMTAERSLTVGLYPAQREQGIIEAINRRDIPLLRTRVSQFAEQMRQGSYTDLIAFSTRLLTELNCKYVPSLGAGRDITLRANYNAMLKLGYCESLDELAQSLTNCCVNICDTLGGSRENLNLHTVLSLKEYAEKHYAQLDISLSSAADEVMLSKDYAGRLFKSAMGISFNDYLNQFRMKQAYRLLTETKETISEISKQIGIANHSYFYTLFRKYHGMTPSDCRRNHQGGGAAEATKTDEKYF